MSDQPDPRALDRRGFLRLVAVAGAAAALPAVARAQAPTPPPATPPATPPAASTAPAAPEAPKPPSADALALAGILDRRYPGRFTPEQVSGFAKDFDGDLALSKRLRATKLTNGDEPDSVFRP